MSIETLVVETSHGRVSKIVESGKLIGISIEEGGSDSLDGLEDGFDSVSYTHLTLPTICSV